MLLFLHYFAYVSFVLVRAPFFLLRRLLRREVITVDETPLDADTIDGILLYHIRDFMVEDSRSTVAAQKERLR